MNYIERERYLTARNFLAETTATVPHSGRTLFVHLVGTHLLLQVNREREAVCLGGLFHSIYGTNIFQHQTFQSDSDADRETVRKVIGAEAEALAYTFCTMPDRPRVFLQRPRPVMSTALAKMWRDLQAIELANLIEQGGFSSVINWL